MKKIWSAVTVVLLTAVSAGVIVYGSSVSDRKIDTSGKTIVEAAEEIMFNLNT